MADDPRQVKIHPNPWSKEGLGEAVVSLQTDMAWIKKMLEKLDQKLDQRDEEWKAMIQKMQEGMEGRFQRMQEQTDSRFRDVEERIQQLEQDVSDLKADQSRLWGAMVGMGALIGFIEFILRLVRGG